MYVSYGLGMDLGEQIFFLWENDGRNKTMGCETLLLQSPDIWLCWGDSYPTEKQCVLLSHQVLLHS